MAMRRGLFAVVHIATRYRKVQPPVVCGGTRGWTRKACQAWADRGNEPGRHPRTRYEVRRMPDWLVEIHEREHAYQSDLRERSNASWQRQNAAFAEWERQMAEGLA